MSNLDPAFAREIPSHGTMTSPAESTTSEEGASHSHRPTDVKDSSVAAGQHVAGVSKEEFHKVGSETKKQAKDLYRETQTELAEQAAVQQKRVAAGLRSLGDEFGTMAESSDAPGVASDLAHQAATRASDLADWLDQRDPGSLLTEVKGFARRRPGMFITIAAVTGVLAGRLTRSVVEDSKDSSENGTPDVGGVPPTPTSAATAPLPPLGSPRVGVKPDFGGVAR